MSPGIGEAHEVHGVVWQTHYEWPYSFDVRHEDHDSMTPLADLLKRYDGKNITIHIQVDE